LDIKQNNLTIEETATESEWRGEVQDVAEWSAILDINEETLRTDKLRAGRQRKAFTKPVSRDPSETLRLFVQAGTRRTNRN